MVPTSLVEAERNGAMLVQNLAELETSSTTGKHDSSAKDSTDSNKKKANGHKEEGLFTRFLLIDTHLAPAYVSHKPDVCAMYCVNSMSICVTVCPCVCIASACLHVCTHLCVLDSLCVCWSACICAFSVFIYLICAFPVFTCGFTCAFPVFTCVVVDVVMHVALIGIVTNQLPATACLLLHTGKQHHRFVIVHLLVIYIIIMTMTLTCLMMMIVGCMLQRLHHQCFCPIPRRQL